MRNTFHEKPFTQTGIYEKKTFDNNALKNMLWIFFNSAQWRQSTQQGSVSLCYSIALFDIVLQLNLRHTICQTLLQVTAATAAKAAAAAAAA